MIRLVTVIGARPQFVKAAVVSHEIAKQRDLREILVHTGQHYDYDMSAVFFKELGLPQPQYHLGVGSKPHGEQTAEILAKLEPILLKEKPHGVIVYGDTNSTLAAALCASKLHIPLAHVEAGLRSWNRFMPEEINRVVADHVSDLLFCPTKTAVKNLAGEGLRHGVYHVGDVMLDAALVFGRLVPANLLSRWGVAANQYFLITLHRAENTDDVARLQTLLGFLLDLPAAAIFPTHPRLSNLLATNRKLWPLRRRLEARSDLHLVPPVSYLEMLTLEKNAAAIITDSGGVQKEAFFYQVPCITLRHETEWVETLAGGCNTLVGANKKKFLAALANVEKFHSRLRQRGKQRTALARGLVLFGGGKACQRIVKVLRRSL